MNKAIANWWTTITGLLAGVTNYLVTIGPNQLPQTKQQWGAFFFSLLLAAFGAVAKDGKTGSPPGATS